MGFWARLPFVVSTGMEMNAYVAFFAVGGLGFVWQQALGMVFWSSILMILLTVTSVREKIIDSIPDSLEGRAVVQRRRLPGADRRQHRRHSEV